MCLHNAEKKLRSRKDSLGEDAFDGEPLELEKHILHMLTCTPESPLGFTSNSATCLPACSVCDLAVKRNMSCCPITIAHMKGQDGFVQLFPEAASVFALCYRIKIHITL